MSELYKLIIVDDEHIIRDGLMSFNWEDYGFSAVFAAANAKEALNFISHNPVDLMIVDIKMPEMSGLELSKKVKELYHNTKVIILSGYKEFEYARKAIENNVYEYLLKPVDLDKLVKTLLKAKKDLEKINFPIAQQKFLDHLLNGKIKSIDAALEKVDFFEMSLDQNFFMVGILNLAKEKRNLKIQTEINKLLLINNLGLTYLKNNEIIFILNLQTNNTKERNKTLNKVLKIVNSVLKNKDYFISFGRIHKNILSISNSYYEARITMENKFFNQEQMIFKAWENNYEKDFLFEYPFEEENTLIDSILMGNLEDCETKFNLLWESIINNKEKIKASIVKNIVIQFLNVVDRNLKGQNLGLEKVYNIKAPFTDFVFNINTLNNMKKELYQLTQLAAKKINESNENTVNNTYPIIEKSKAFIHENYSNKITLSSLAEHVALNPSYLSALFKKETGCNFIDYLTEIRLKNAEKLLENLDLKIYQVGNQVGYNNSKYFCEVFKKNYGITPNQYRKKYYRK